MLTAKDVSCVFDVLWINWTVFDLIETYHVLVINIGWTPDTPLSHPSEASIPHIPFAKTFCCMSGGVVMSFPSGSMIPGMDRLAAVSICI